jgi:predicted HAD superfamily Cof-like phosphohydrolase
MSSPTETISSSSNFHKVHTFNTVAGIYTQDTPDPKVFKDTKLIDLRLSLIIEEVKELKEAVDNKNFTEVIDALADILYVVYGMGSSLGISLINVHSYKISKVFPPVFPEESDLMILYSYYNFLNDATSNQDFSNISLNLMNMINTVYIISMKCNIDINRAFDIVHQSNMSKFPSTEEEAKKTVEWYLNYEKKYDSPNYRKKNEYYVVYNETTGKILKSIKYVPANFDSL